MNNNLPPDPSSPDISFEEHRDLMAGVSNLLRHGDTAVTEGGTTKFTVPVVGTENHLLVEGVQKLTLEHVEGAKLPDGGPDLTSVVAETSDGGKELYVLMDSGKGKWLSAVAASGEDFLKLETMDGVQAERLLELFSAAEAEFRPPHAPVSDK